MKTTTRKECLNCTNKIDNEGDAFCKTCEPGYYLCIMCDTVQPLTNKAEGEHYECKTCDVWVN